MNAADFRYGNRIFLNMFFAAVLLIPSGFSCSIQKLAVNATGGIIDNTLESIFEESDLVLAEAAIPAQLKMLEGLIKSDPGNRNLLLKVVFGYTGYSLGFVEDVDKDRAKALYKKARDYGLQLLRLDINLRAGLDGSLNEFETAIKTTTIKDVPALFWTANAWASYINLSLGDPAALFDFSKVRAMMSRVIELDESFYYGGAHLFYGMIYSSMGIAGGDIEKAKEHFDRAAGISNNKFLLTKVYFARYYAVSEIDEELFKKTLQEVIDLPGDLLPEVRLVNEIAKKKAHLYLSMIDEWF